MIGSDNGKTAHSSSPNGEEAAAEHNDQRPEKRARTASSSSTLTDVSNTDSTVTEVDESSTEAIFAELDQKATTKLLEKLQNQFLMEESTGIAATPITRPLVDQKKLDSDFQELVAMTKTIQTPPPLRTQPRPNPLHTLAQANSIPDGDSWVSFATKTPTADSRTTGWELY